MSIFGGTLLIGLFIGLHLLLHRGQGAHGGRTDPETAPSRHQHGAGSGTDTTPAQARKHQHGGC
jgi:hypothetical protein